MAGPGAADELSGIDYRLATRQNRFRYAGDLDTLEHRIVDTHVMCFYADHVVRVWIEDDDVSIRPYRDGAFAREQAEKSCGRGGDDFDEAIDREALAVDAAGVDQAEAMFDTRAAVRDFGEVVFA